MVSDFKQRPNLPVGIWSTQARSRPLHAEQWRWAANTGRSNWWLHLRRDKRLMRRVWVHFFIPVFGRVFWKANIHGHWCPTKPSRIWNGSVRRHRKLVDIEPVLFVEKREKAKDRDATAKETTCYRSFVGKLLYVGRLAFPVITFHASEAATERCNLKFYHIKALNSLLTRS